MGDNLGSVRFIRMSKISRSPRSCLGKSIMQKVRIVMTEGSTIKFQTVTCLPNEQEDIVLLFLLKLARAIFYGIVPN
jgi:hypothetical protein